MKLKRYFLIPNSKETTKDHKLNFGSVTLKKLALECNTKKQVTILNPEKIATIKTKEEMKSYLQEELQLKIEDEILDKILNNLQWQNKENPFHDSQIDQSLSNDLVDLLFPIHEDICYLNENFNLS